MTPEEEVDTGFARAKAELQSERVDPLIQVADVFRYMAIQRESRLRKIAEMAKKERGLSSGTADPACPWMVTIDGKEIIVLFNQFVVVIAHDNLVAVWTTNFL